ncbi:hypothetical protein ACFL6N_02970 [Thermodesulfobacteriota bacterium]
MKISFFQVDALTQHVFAGNHAILHQIKKNRENQALILTIVIVTAYNIFKNE